MSNHHQATPRITLPSMKSAFKPPTSTEPLNLSRIVSPLGGCTKSSSPILTSPVLKEVKKLYPTPPVDMNATYQSFPFPANSNSPKQPRKGIASPERPASPQHHSSSPIGFSSQKHQNEVCTRDDYNYSGAQAYPQPSTSSTYPFQQHKSYSASLIRASEYRPRDDSSYAADPHTRQSLVTRPSPGVILPQPRSSSITSATSSIDVLAPQRSSSSSVTALPNRGQAMKLDDIPDSQAEKRLKNAQSAKRYFRLTFIQK
jgi:hypothetical protein